MKKIYTILASLILLTLFGCSQQRDNMLDLDQPNEYDGTITLTAYAPDWDAETRALLTEKDGSLDLIASFQATDKVRVFIVQSDVLYDLGDVAFASISDDGKIAKLTLTLPAEVDASKPVNIIGYNGLNQGYITVDGNKAMLSVSAFKHNAIETFKAPVYFRMMDVTPTVDALKEFTTKFQHLGAYEIVHFENKSDTPISAKVTLSEVSKYGAQKSWGYQDGYKSGKGTVYYSYDIITGEVIEGADRIRSDFYKEPTIAPNETKSVISWVMPDPACKGLPAMVIDFYDTAGGYKNHQSKGMIPAKNFNMQVGKVYHAYGYWDGSKVVCLDPETNEGRPTPYISFTTGIPVGKTLKFKSYVSFLATDASWVDYNDNGVKDDITESAPKNFQETQVSVKAPKITFHGGFESIQIAEQEITDIEVSPVMNSLTELDIRDNKMSAEALNKLFEQLPDISHIEVSILQSKKLSIEGNPGVEGCNPKLAIKKGWILDIVIIDESQPYIMLGLSTYGSKELYFFIDADEKDREGVWVDLNGDGEKGEGEAIDRFGEKGRINVTSTSSDVIFYGNITKLDFLQASAFAYYGGTNSALKYLNLANTGVVAAVTDGHPNLEFLNLNGNQLYTVYVPLKLDHLTKLKVLDLGNCQAGEFDYSNNTALTYLNVEGNGMKTLDIAALTNLRQLICSSNEIKTLDISKATGLLHLEATQNQLSAEQVNLVIKNLPNRNGKSKGGFWIAGNPGTGAANLDIAKGKNWNVDARNSKADNSVRRPIMEGEDW